MQELAFGARAPRAFLASPLATIAICQVVKVFIIILSIVIYQRRPTPGLPLGDTCRTST